MSNEEEVLRIAKKLDKMAAKKNADSALDVLNALKKIQISLATLKKTRIGMSVNSIRKQTKNEEVAVAAKQLIKGWKKLVGNDEPNGNKKPEPRKSDDTEPEISTTIQKEKQVERSNSTSSFEMDSTATLSLTNNPVRDKCREMLLRGLMADGQSGHSSSRCTFVAAAIEEAIFVEFKDTGTKYKNRVRSRFSNLKDAKNIGLRMNVLNGVVKPEKVAKMTAEEMASDEMKKLREAYEEENIKDHQMAVNEGTKTDMFSCGRCKGKSCTYNQGEADSNGVNVITSVTNGPLSAQNIMNSELQTRSSDEPMTTFVFCNDCGNRWKFC